jgi:hypothetical protein
MGAPPERVDEALDSTSTSAQDAMILLIREILDSEAEAARLEAEEARMKGKNTVCGQPLSPADRKVWRQAIALLLGLKLKNGFGETDLTVAVGTALRRGATKRNCEDCGVVVAGGAANSGHGGSAVSLRLAVPKLAQDPPIIMKKTSPARSKPPCILAL